MIYLTLFPEPFRFQLTNEEVNFLRFQFVTLENENKSLRFQNGTLKNEDGRGKHRKYLPYVFTEQGVSMLSAVLRSETAIKVSITIMNAFVEMRKFITSNASIFNRLDTIELKQLDAEKFNTQYPTLKIKQFSKAHDRFLFIDENEVFHIGASLKDLGKKWFAFSKMDKGSVTIIKLIMDLL